MSKSCMAEKGNVLFLILIAVVLFAALSYAVTQSSRGGGNANSESLKIKAAQLTQYGAAIKTAVMRMKLTGTDDAEFCFDTDLIAEPKWYDGAPGCADDGNKVFHADGGGATFQDIDETYLDSGYSASDQYGLPIFTGRSQVALIGENTEAELLMLVPYLKLEICEELNRSLGIPLPIEHDYTCCGIDVAKQFNGSYGGQDAIGAHDDVTDPARRTIYEGFSEGCFSETSGGLYIYYHVLLER